MASGEADADDLGRLEAALDRIAARAPQPANAALTNGATVSARLDRLINQLRDALAEAVAGDPALGEA